MVLEGNRQEQVVPVLIARRNKRNSVIFSSWPTEN
jgi:hypothetical protein